MIVIAGSFRLPPGAAAQTALVEVVESTRREPGCMWYSYARDVDDHEVVRVSEGWASRASLEAHLAAPHMERWRSVRETLGLRDRQMRAYETDEGQPL